ncbi:MAG: flagellar basal body P-ring formation protein FlgA [Gammaproteobacteria bacterium]|nr:flagellar basal body P-ring formation protein FlgA [Gammaproteobacteria bacterium]
MKWGRFFAKLLLTGMSISVFAAEIQNLQQLKSIAENYIQHKLQTNSDRKYEIQSGKLDPRLRLVQCDSLPEAFTPPGSTLQGNTTVGIRCNSPKPWSIYIPVKIAIYQQAMVATIKLARGHILSDDDITLEEVDISRIRGQAFTDSAPLTGTKLKTSVQPGQVLDTTHVCLVCKGDPVTITADDQLISISMSGIALNDGSKGDIIRVQNNASRLIIDATIMDNHTVTVGI